MDNPVADKSFQFAIRIVKLYKHLQSEKAEYVLSKQLQRAADYLTEREAESMLRDCTELEKLLTAIIKTMKQRKT